MKFVIWLLAILIAMPSPVLAQDDSKKDKKIDKTTAIVGGAVLGGVILGSLLKKKKKDKAEESTTETQEATIVAEETQFIDSNTSVEEGEVVEFSETSADDSEERPMRIITNHPDFKIKIKRCEVSGKTCVIDMVIENVGYEDVTYYTDSDWFIGYDDEMTEYSNFKVAIGNSNWIMDRGYRKLMSNIPMKARIQIEGVPAAATMFRRIDWTIVCNAWNLSKEKKVKFLNIPITREGE